MLPPWPAPAGCPSIAATIENMALVECVPNFSEGIDNAIVDALANAAGAHLIHRTSDADHNRSVLTLAGEPEAMLEAAEIGRAHV